MSKRRLFSLFCSLGLLIATAVAAPLITPGKGIPEATLGEARKSVEKKLGAPQDTDRNEFNGDVYALYYSRGIELVYTNDKLSMITLHGPDKQWKPYPGATKEGLSVATPPGNVPKILGAPNAAKEGVLNYTSRGLVIQVKNNRIDTLILRPPGA